jgi:hypothetical protein
MIKSIIILILLVTTACSINSKRITPLRLSSDGTEIVCNVTKIKHVTYSNKDTAIFNLNNSKQSTIYAVIDIYNVTNQSLDINIKNYAISYKGLISGRTYIDSIADVIIKDEKIEPGAHIVKKVYWTIEGHIDDNDSDKLKLVGIKR